MAGPAADWIRRMSRLAQSSVVRVSLARFVLLSVLALLVLGVGIRITARNLAEKEAMTEATNRAQGVARGVVSALVTPQLRAGDPESLDQVAQALAFRLGDGTFSHIILFDADGDVLWSDQPSLINQRVPLDAELRQSMRSGGLVTRLPGSNSRHPATIGDEDRLLEVHVPLPDASGGPVVFEAYVDTVSIAEQRDDISQRTLPIALGALLLFQLTVLPLAWSLARRIDRARRDQSDLLRRSMRAWHEERRRLARDLHDGVVQDLSAVGYALPSVAAELPTASTSARATLDRFGDVLQQDVAALRTLILDLMPVDLHEIGLAAALRSLADRNSRDDLEITVEVEDGVDPGEDLLGLVYRVVREGLRNVQKHARANNAWVHVSREDDIVTIVLTDDGRGLGEAGRRQGFGLRLLQALVDDVGGTFDLRDRQSGGTRLEVRFPASLPS